MILFLLQAICFSFHAPPQVLRSSLYSSGSNISQAYLSMNFALKIFLSAWWVPLICFVHSCKYYSISICQLLFLHFLCPLFLKYWYSWFKCLYLIIFTYRLVPLFSIWDFFPLFMHVSMEYFLLGKYFSFKYKMLIF